VLPWWHHISFAVLISASLTRFQPYVSLTRFQLYVSLTGCLCTCHVPMPQDIFPKPQQAARCAAMVASHLLCRFDLSEPDAFPALREPDAFPALREPDAFPDLPDPDWLPV
jgi:hypothetical protein